MRRNEVKMPTLASATVICHLYREPVTGKSADGKTWTILNGWTSDKIKVKGSPEAVKKFTSFEGFVNGPQADWLARDGKKGSMVAVSGTFYAEATEKDGKHSCRVVFTRITECRILDGEREAKEDAAADIAPAPRRPASPAVTEDEPPF